MSATSVKCQCSADLSLAFQKTNYVSRGSNEEGAEQDRRLGRELGLGSLHGTGTLLVLGGGGYL